MTGVRSMHITPELGMSIREETIKYFCSTQFLNVLHAVVNENELAKVIHLPASIDISAIRADLETQTAWEEEFWTIDNDGDVSKVAAGAFFSSSPHQRFSRSDCLRRPTKNAFAIRGLISGLRSPEVSEAFTGTCGIGPQVMFKSADIARYRHGHYLRRHDDRHDGRKFGIIFFLHADWKKEFGTRLLAEKPDGRCTVVDPVPNSIAVMRLADNHYHQVEPNFSITWSRYSLAIHFGLTHD